MYSFISEINFQCGECEEMSWYKCTSLEQSVWCTVSVQYSVLAQYSASVGCSMSFLYNVSVQCSVSISDQCWPDVLDWYWMVVTLSSSVGWTFLENFQSPLAAMKQKPLCSYSRVFFLSQLLLKWSDLKNPKQIISVFLGGALLFIFLSFFYFF